jgi:cyclopropane fatty-acyl-phospholipid synthase-like methyltransferase
VSSILHAPAAERNRVPILEVLRAELPATGRVLEIASGTGQHVVHFAEALPGITWLPSDPDPRQWASIAARVAQSGLGNVEPPLDLDVRSVWAVHEVDAVIVANLLHISEPETLSGLCEGAAGALGAGGLLHIYGPFRRGGSHTSPGNRAFDASLQAQNPAWGIRDLESVLAVAEEQGFVVRRIVDMPANNLSLVLRLNRQ